MKLDGQWLELEAVTQLAADSARDAAAGLRGLESRFEDCIARIGQSRTREELQGFAEFLLHATTGIRESIEREQMKYANLADALCQQRELVAGLVADTGHE